MIEIQPPLPSDTGEAAVSRNALWSDAFSEHGVIGKIVVNSFSFQATEIVFTSKWGRIQPEIQILPDQVVAASSTLAGSPWK